MAYISVYADLDSVFSEISDEQLLFELCRRMDHVLSGLEDYEPNMVSDLEIIAKQILEKAPAILAQYEKEHAG